MRHCISSTELLFEKAMQRVYQTMQLEEANEMASKRRSTSIAYQSNERIISTSAKRKLSGTNGTTDASNASSRRNSFKKKLIDESQPPLMVVTKENSQIKVDIETTINSHKEILTAIQNDYTEQEEEEQQRDLKKEIIDAQQRISVYRHQTSPSSLEFADDYTDSTASSASSLDSLEKFIATVKTMANKNDSDELETYHPRMENNAVSYQSNLIQQTNLIKHYQNSEFQDNSKVQSNNNDSVFSIPFLQQPESSNSSCNSHESVKERSRALSPYRQPDPDQSTIELNKPHPLPDPDFIPKPILKRPVSPDPHPLPEPIQSAAENEKTNKSERKGGIMQFFTSKKSSSNNSLTTSQDKLKTEIPNETLTKSQQARKSMIERRQSSIEENKVMIDHYSDIVKEVSSSHKPPKQSIYLSDSTSKIDAEKSNTFASNVEPKSINKLPTTSSNDMINVPKNTKANESYSRSIFAIKLSKDTKKIPIVDNEKSKVMIQSSTELDTNSNQSPNINLTENTSQLVNSEDMSLKKIERAQSRSTEIKTSKRKPSKVRDRSSSAARSKLQTTKEKEKSTEQATAEKSTTSRTQNKRLRSESKSPATKNRNALLVQNKGVSFQAVKKDEQSPSPRCQTPEEFLEQTNNKVKSTMNYITDIGIFCVACWVYMFKDARLALPILALMIYRQLIEALKEKCPKWIKWKRE